MDSKRLDTIPGYIHPETTTTKPRGTVYKTFTEGKKAKKKEKFGSTVSGNQYASYNITQTTNKNQHEIEKERQTFEQMHSQQEK